MKEVLIKKQKMKDNIFVGYTFKMVSAKTAERHLSLPLDLRHPHWRAVEYATPEEITKYGKKEKQEPETIAKSSLSEAEKKAIRDELNADLEESEPKEEEPVKKSVGRPKAQ